MSSKPELFTRQQERDRIFLAIAEDLAMMGTCSRGHVGAVIIREGRCISWGYNGAPPGMPHCDQNFHGWLEPEVAVSDGTFKHTWADEQLAQFGCRNATHAEANAISFAARQGISTDGASLYVGTSPCRTCSFLIIAAGIVTVVYGEEYRDRSGVDLLEQAGVETYRQFKPE